MAGKRATEFKELLRVYRVDLGLKKEEAIGFLAASSEVPGWVRSKALRMVRRAEKKAAREDRE